MGSRAVFLCRVVAPNSKKETTPRGLLASEFVFFVMNDRPSTLENASSVLLHHE